MRTNSIMEMLPDMVVFVRVVELGSFTAVANSLGKTPSSVSRQIARLEQKIGARLLMRTTRQLRLSEVGKSVYQSCSEMFAAAISATEVATNFNANPHGLVRASAPMTYGKIVISPHVSSFLQLYPDINVQLILTDRVVDLIDDAMDLVIRIEQNPAPGLAARRLMTVKYVLCVSTEYVKRRGMPKCPQDLKDHDCLFFGDNVGDCKWNFQRDLEQVAVTVRGRFIVNHSEAMREAVENGVGIGFLPFFTAREAIEKNILIQIFQDWKIVTPYQGSAWVLYLPNRFLPPKTRLFIDHLSSRIDEL